MSKSRQLIVFSNGDAWNASTWSNVPYMFLTTFKGLCPDVDIRVFDMSLVDSGPFLSIVAKLWNRLIPPKRGALCTFDRTKLRHRLLRRKMSDFIERVTSGGGILLSFDFSNPAPKRDGYKVCLLCDWTIDYAIREHQRCEPTAGEQGLIMRQEKAIADSDHAAVLFPHSAELIRAACPDVEVAYYGLPSNVVGNVTPRFNRAASRRIVFIGKPAYLPSLLVVVEGLTRFNAAHPGSELRLDVIGMQDGPGDGDSVVYHGFLRKDNEDERFVYYSLVRSARALVTVSQEWVGASSIVEAMSLGTPVIVSPNIELRAMFKDEGWGFWCGCSASDVEERLSELDGLSEADLERMCQCAANAVRDFTWEKFVTRWCEDVGFAVNS